MQLRNDTIVALATAPGRAALAVLRVSGPAALALARSVCREPLNQARVATHTAIVDPNTTEAIDDALVTPFIAPNSYTGEDVVEFSCHGGRAVVTAVQDLLLSRGARAAEPGEFTLRAVLNGRLDLLQAEAVADVIDAPTQAARRLAIRQLHGALSRVISDLRARILDLEALVAYDVDFPEEDDGPISRDRIADSARHVSQLLTEMLATAPVGEALRGGLRVVIAGEPNAGKSSLFNALLGAKRAIVTEIPGTTRDALEAHIDIGPWPIRLIDTAGLHPSTDPLELAGIQVTREQIEQADLIVACAETPDAMQRTERELARGGVLHVPILAVYTKADQHPPLANVIQASAHTRVGLDRILHAVEVAAGERMGAASSEVPILSRERHRRALSDARAEVEAFHTAWQHHSVPATIAAVHLRAACHALDELIGTIGIEDVLGRVFSTFCVGK